MSKIMMSEEMKSAPAAPSPLRRLLCWEGFLLAVTLAVFVVNALCSAALFFAPKIKKNCTDKTCAIALCKIDC